MSKTPGSQPAASPPDLTMGRRKSVGFGLDNTELPDDQLFKEPAT